MTVPQLAATHNLPSVTECRPNSRKARMRRQTERWLRHYGEFANGAGRIAAVRCGVTYRAHALDNAVIETIDLERSLRLLQPQQCRLLHCIYAEGQSISEAAETLGCAAASAWQQHIDALDALTGILVQRRLLS